MKAGVVNQMAMPCMGACMYGGVQLNVGNPVRKGLRFSGIY
jgi:hypothetical protein